MLDMYNRTKEASDTTSESMQSAVMESNGNPSVGQQAPVGSLLLERRSLVLIKDDLYSAYLHGIADRTQDTLSEDVWNLDQCSGRRIGDVLDRSARISLTIRNIPKVTYLNRKK